MRHKKSGRKFNRSGSHRKAMLKNMVRSLLTYEHIRTTEPKAKELRSSCEKLITLALRNDLHSRRLAFKTLENHGLVQKLFDEIGPRYNGGGGGYTRIIKLAEPRKGDCAPMCIIELTKRAEEAPVKEAPVATEAPAEEAEA
ncbi:50S ribosomal protein L17 [Maridesulfovibrio zosterae]|uniref:50S ribosomal protein L17 n=1 Tax=Maridesulfovibrio zosterae TaxID=82171 RepID=UPI00048168E9|nr:50S ribosomal protein L17 [Maridesulfovibrio zosterae]